MGNDKKKKVEPTCGCGRPDLYEELLKHQKNNKDKTTNTSTSYEMGDNENPEDKGKNKES